MSLATLIRSMSEAGATPEAIALAVEAIEAVQATIDAKKEAARDKKRRQREGRSQDKEGTVPGQDGDMAGTVPAEPLSLPPSPQTPQPPTHTRESVTTREAEVRENAAFERFWAMYPRKTAKADARKAFGRAWKKLPPFEEETILLGALVNVKATWTDAQFIPHAATWLNGERWTDEPAEVSPISPRGPRNERPNGHSPAATSRATRRGVWAEVLAEECGPPTGLRAVS